MRRFQLEQSGAWLRIPVLSGKVAQGVRFRRGDLSAEEEEETTKYRNPMERCRLSPSSSPSESLLSRMGGYH